MKSILWIIFILLAVQVTGQSIRPNIENLVRKIELYNVLDSEHVGIAGETTIQYKNFVTLRNQATIEELLILLGHDNSVVKGYATWALVDKKYLHLSEIMTKFLRTGEIVMTQNGCNGMEEELTSILYYRTYYQHIYNKLSFKDSLFFDYQIQQLDSVILYSDKEIHLLSTALSNNNGNSGAYNRIRHMALENKNKDAIIALAIYQKDEDISDIMKLGEQSFIAISKFPSPKFWDFLLTYYGITRTKEYMFAFAAFKSIESASILKNIYHELNGKSIPDLCEALTKNYCVHYQDILFTIWENYKTIDLRATKLLINENPNQAAIVFTNGLLKQGDFNFLEYDYDYGTYRLILPLMLSHIKQYQQNQLLPICKTNIRTAKFEELGSFLNIVKDNKLTDTEDVILERLNQKNIPFEIFYLTETILSFKNKENEIKVKFILQNRKEDWDRGNWSTGFRELLKEYHIQID